MGCCYVQRYACAFSIHVGIVIICSMGVMAMTISTIANIVVRDPEINPSYIAAHWIIVLVYLGTGFFIYCLGMISAFTKVYRLAYLTCVFLLMHFVYWFILCALSFINDYTINRIFCIDNRCADRLFIKNSGWRRIDSVNCENPSYKISYGWRSEDNRTTTVPTLESQRNPSFNEANPGEFQDESRIFKNDKGQMKSRSFPIKSFPFVDKLEESTVDPNSNGPTKANELDKFKVYVDTPLGKVGCGNVPHLAVSFFCATLIFILWYLYPIAVFHSYAKKLKDDHYAEIYIKKYNASNFKSNY